MEIVEFADPTSSLDFDDDSIAAGNAECTVPTCDTDDGVSTNNTLDIVRSKFYALCCSADDDDECIRNNRYQAFDDLCTLGIVCDVNLKKQTIRLDIDRLYSVGYILIYDNVKRIPMFIRCCDLSFVYNCILYMSDCIYVKSLESFDLIKIKQHYSS